MPGAVSCFGVYNLHSRPLERYPGLPYFIDKENEAQGGYITHPRSHSQ